MANIDAKLCKQHFSTKIFKSYLYYLKEHYPDLDPIKLCEECGLPFDYIQNEDNWVSITFERRFFNACKRITGDEKLAYNVGLVSLSKEIIGAPLYYLIRNALSLGEIYGNIPKLSPMFSKMMEVKIERSSFLKIDFLYTYLTTNLTDEELTSFRDAIPDIVDNTKGYFAGIPTVKDLPQAKLEFIDTKDGFKLNVIPPPDYKIFNLNTLKFAIPFVGVVAGTIFLKVSIPLAVITTIMLLAGIFFTKKYKLTKEAASQTQDALNKVDHQFIELQATKLELQRKLQEYSVINNVTEAISKELSQKNIIDRACQSLTQDLAYDRVIVLLENLESQQIQYESSAGLDQTLLTVFKNFRIPTKIDSDDPRKLTNVFRFGKPVVISDVKTHLNTLLPEFRNLLSTSNSSSFICAPIQTESGKYGLIIADCYKKEKVLGEADLRIIQIIGTQIAQSLERHANRQRELAAFERASKYQDGVLDLTMKQLNEPVQKIIQALQSLDTPNPRFLDNLLEVESILEKVKNRKVGIRTSNSNPKIHNVPSQSPFQASRKGARIMIVEDNPDKLSFLCNILREEGHQVQAFSLAVDAIESLSKGYRPELILLDVMMPIISGYEASKEIRKLLNRADVPIIFMHNSRQEPDFEMGLKSGGTDFIDKDLSGKEFNVKLRAIVHTARMTQSYSRFIPWKTFELLNYKSALDVKLGDSIESEMSVLFCDIRNFTTLCETLSPTDVLAFLNSYLKVISPVISENGGYIDSFMGDGIMASFPNATNSLNAARGMISAVNKMNHMNEFERFGKISIGVGINTGPVIMGPIGFEGRLQITSISDSVNTASRVESLCKEFGASIIITEAARSTLPENLFKELRLLGQVNVKGKNKSIRIFEDLNSQNLEEKYVKEKHKQLFELGVNQFISSQYSESLTTFTKMSGLQDKAVQYYLDKLNYLSPTLHELKKVA